jgi:hypothetical protein
LFNELKLKPYISIFLSIHSKMPYSSLRVATNKANLEYMMKMKELIESCPSVNKEHDYEFGKEVLALINEKIEFIKNEELR